MAIGILILMVTIATLFCLARMEDRLLRLERRLDEMLGELRAAARTGAVPATPAPVDAELPAIRLTLQDAGTDLDAVAQVLSDRMGMTRASADALVRFLPAELPLARLSAQEAYDLRAALSSAGAIASLFLRPQAEAEPHPTRPSATRTRPDGGA